MLTILHQRDGLETFHQAESVSYHGPFALTGHGGRLIFEIVQPNATFMITGGTVYVMNAAGATVGKYDLGLDGGMPAPAKAA